MSLLQALQPAPPPSATARPIAAMEPSATAPHVATLAWHRVSPTQSDLSLLLHTWWQDTQALFMQHAAQACQAEAARLEGFPAAATAPGLPEAHVARLRYTPLACG